METFRELAWLAENQADHKALTELLALHLQQHPEDPWSGYYIARREQAAGNYTAAISALVTAEQADDEGLRSLTSHLKTELYLQSDNVSQAYLTGGQPQEAFLRIATRLSQRGEWDRVLNLSQLHAAAAPNDATSLYFATKARWRLQQYQQLAQNLTPWPTERLKNLNQAWIAEIADLHVRSWLRVGSEEEARKVAQFVRDDLGVTLPLVAVELAAGNRDRVTELLGDPVLGRDLFLRQLQHDPDLAAILTDQEFAGLRQRYALERPNDYGRQSVALVLLLKEAPDESRWTAAFDAAIGTAANVRSVQFAPPESSPQGEARPVPRTSRLVDLPGGTLIATAAAAPYGEQKHIPVWLAQDSPLRQALEKHSGWIAIDLFQADQQTAVHDAQAAMHALRRGAGRGRRSRDSRVGLRGQCAAPDRSGCRGARATAGWTPAQGIQPCRSADLSV